MRIGQEVAVASMIVSGTLAVVKIVTGLMAGSTSVVADGLESAGDVFASGLVFLGLTVAAKPPDWNHPYGHGRAETITGMGVGLILPALVYEHYTARKGDLGAINRAFFYSNAFVGLVFVLAALEGVLLPG